MRVLILGGTTEASQLARALAEDKRFEATLSLAGRTANPVRQPLPCRRGGFGGDTALATWLVEQRVETLIDATHPFAAQMSRQAATAASRASTPLLAIRRPAWKPEPGDRWHIVASLAEAAHRLGHTPRRVFLTIGQQGLAPFAAAPQHAYLIRSVDPPPPAMLPPCAEVITRRGPFTEAEEYRLLLDRQIEVLVTKNSGGTATVAKLVAARRLGLPVIMVSRPDPPAGVDAVATADGAMRWLADRHRMLRGA
ncbi:MAG: cobalt-precorrin-6A reductase [Acetobacteraceae bacterium]|nr:cobalt-precorrin-6A reductase [Acetobacteraceae bacterium]